MADKFIFKARHFFDPYFPLRENWLAFDKESAIEDTTNWGALHTEGFMTENDPADAVVPSIIDTN